MEKNKTSHKKQLFDKEFSSDESSTQLSLHDNESDVGDPEINRCLISNDIGNYNELWFSCRGCGNLTHGECADCESANDFNWNVCIIKR